MQRQPVFESHWSDCWKEQLKCIIYTSDEWMWTSHCPCTFSTTHYSLFSLVIQNNTNLNIFLIYLLFMKTDVYFFDTRPLFDFLILRWMLITVLSAVNLYNNLQYISKSLCQIKFIRLRLQLFCTFFIHQTKLLNMMVSSDMDFSWAPWH